VINPQFNVFGRYDWVKPTHIELAGTGGSVKDQYLNLGVDYKPIAPLDIAEPHASSNARRAAASWSDAVP